MIVRLKICLSFRFIDVNNVYILFVTSEISVFVSDFFK